MGSAGGSSLRSPRELAPRHGFHDTGRPESDVCRHADRRGTESQAAPARLMRRPDHLLHDFARLFQKCREELKRLLGQTQSRAILSKLPRLHIQLEGLEANVMGARNAGGHPSHASTENSLSEWVMLA